MTMALTTHTTRPVLQINASIDPFDQLDLTVYRGEFVLAHCPNRAGMNSLLRIASGMQLLDPGQVKFLEKDWTQVDPDHAAALRGSLGLSPMKPAWVAYHTLLENLVLTPLHHRTHTRDELTRQAAALCRQMGLPSISLDRPERVTPDDLSRASIARAFMGSKRLVILEQPDASMMAPVVNLGRSLCRRGGAVLWLTTDQRMVSRPPFAARPVQLRRPMEEATV